MAPFTYMETMKTTAERPRRRCSVNAWENTRRPSIDQGHLKLVPERDVLPRLQTREFERELMRCTTSAAAGVSPLPFVAICDPFVDPVNKINKVPLRCPHCEAYIDKHSHVEPHGNCAEFECCMCMETFTVEPYRDYEFLHDTKTPTLDFFASPAIDSSRASVPKAPACCFVVDVHAVHHVLDALEGSTSDMLASLVVFDDATVHFCADRIVSVSIEDAFVPRPAHELLKPLSFLGSADVLSIFRSLFHPTASKSYVFAASCAARGAEALKVGTELLGDRGGGACMFVAKEAPLRLPDVDHLIDHSVSVDAFCGGDFCKLRSLCAETGGKLISPPSKNENANSSCRRFSQPNLERRTISDPSHNRRRSVDRLPNITSSDSVNGTNSSFDEALQKFGPVARNWIREVSESHMGCVVRLRVSRGWKVVESYWRSTDAFEISRLRDEHSFAFEIVHQNELSRKLRYCYMQLVVLHTAPNGDRLLRVHTHWVPVVHSVRAIYQSAYCEALANVLTRVPSKSKMIELYSKWLYDYWQFCVDRGALSNQRYLCLPMSLQYLPLFLLGLRKRWEIVRRHFGLSIRRSSALLLPISSPNTLLCRDTVDSEEGTVLCDSETIYVVHRCGDARPANWELAVDEVKMTFGETKEWAVECIDVTRLPTDWLIEDPTVTDFDYPGFVRHLHKEIMYKVV
eukprot:GEMP01020809.1.p1 GENE.GEMP01020809.1~~GEMP01020809.1.p1  ORF type:complete len:686 (+),score=110.04 GEMP01020809.1:399-2456(+)